MWELTRADSDTRVLVPRIAGANITGQCAVATRRTGQTLGRRAGTSSASLRAGWGGVKFILA